MRIGLFVSWIVERRDVIEAEMDSFLTVPRRERRRKKRYYSLNKR